MINGGKIGFTRKSIIKTKDMDKSILEMRKKELESETFGKISTFLDKYNRRQAVNKEKELFEILETNEFNRIRFFLNSLLVDELNSNIYLRTAKNALRNIKFNCSKRIIRLNEDLFTDNSKENGELTFELSEGMEDFLISKVNTSIDIITRDGKEEIEVLDKKNIRVYKEYNEIVDKVNGMMVSLYYIVFAELASKLSIVVDDIKLVTTLNTRKVVIKYHLDEKVSKIFRNQDLKVEALKDTIFTRRQITDMSLYSFSHYLNNVEDNKNKQKVFPN